MVLTNNSMQTPRDLSAKLVRMGLNIAPERFWTSATATAHFLSMQAGESSAYAIGEAGLTTAIHEQGWILTDADPALVALGERAASPSERSPQRRT